MSDQDAFERILASLYDAMLDEALWPATSALIDEACGMQGNALLVGEGPKDDVRALLRSGSTTGGNAAKTGSASTSDIYHPYRRDACSASGNCPTAAWFTPP